jgi:hypothetical protein
MGAMDRQKKFREFFCGIFAGQEGLESWKLKNLRC